MQLENLEKKTLTEEATVTEEATAPEGGIARKKHRLLRSKAVRTRKIVRMKSGIDRPFLIIVILLLCIGTTMVFTSSYAYAKNEFGDSYYFVSRQMIWLAISAVIMWLCTIVDYLIIKKFTKVIMLVSILLLIAVLFFGKNVNGATRWIEIGPGQLQPSEIAKVAVVLFFAEYIEKIYCISI